MTEAPVNIKRSMRYIKACKKVHDILDPSSLPKLRTAFFCGSMKEIQRCDIYFDVLFITREQTTKLNRVLKEYIIIPVPMRVSIKIVKLLKD